MAKGTFVIQEEPRIVAAFESEQDPKIGYDHNPEKRETFFQISFYGCDHQVQPICLTKHSDPSEYQLSEYFEEKLAESLQADWEIWLINCIAMVNEKYNTTDHFKKWITQYIKMFSKKNDSDPKKLIVNSISVHCLSELEGRECIPVKDILFANPIDAAQKMISRLGFDLTVEMNEKSQNDNELILSDAENKKYLTFSMEKMNVEWD